MSRTLTANGARDYPIAVAGWRAVGTLLGLLLVVGAGGLFLYRFAGVPRLPAAAPDWGAAWETLQGADVPIEASLDILATVAWGLWLWLAASVVLRLLVLVAEVATNGAAWVGTLRTLSDRLTLPVVRRVVDGAVVASVVVQLAGRATPVGAASLEGSAVGAPLSYVSTVAEPSVADTQAAPAPTPTPEGAVHRVRAGDSLWSIALRHYGTGDAYPRIVDANVGRVMADGRTFTRSGVIQPGWELRVPLPERSGVADELETYVVQPGDSLSAIAGELLGRREAWTDLFDLNRGVARLPDGRTLTRPDLIWPGLQLRVPAPAVPAPAMARIALAPSSDATAPETEPEAQAFPAIGAVLDSPAAPADDAHLPDAVAPVVPVSPVGVPTSHGEGQGDRLAVGSGGGESPAPFAESAPAWPTEMVSPPIAPDSSSVTGTTESRGMAGEVPALSSSPDATSVTGTDGARGVAGATEELEGSSGAEATTVPGVGAASGGYAGPAGFVPAADAATPGGARGGVAGETRPLPAPAAPEGLGIAGVAGLAAGSALLVGAGVTVLRRRARRSLREHPVTGSLAPPFPYGERLDVTFVDGFAEMDVARTLFHRRDGGDVDLLAAAVGQLRRFLCEHGLTDVGVLTVEQERGATGMSLDVTLRATPPEQVRIAALAPSLGARLGGTGQAEATPDGDVLLSLSEVRTIALFAPAGPAGAAGSAGVAGASGTEANAARDGMPSPCPMLVPVGAASTRRVLEGALDELRHVLVAGMPGGGGGAVLTGLVASLVARFRPDELRLLTIGDRRLIAPEVLAMPHQVSGPVESSDAARVEEVVGAVRAELVRRIRAADLERRVAGDDDLTGHDGPWAGREAGEAAGGSAAGVRDGRWEAASSDGGHGAPWPALVLLIPELIAGATRVDRAEDEPAAAPGAAPGDARDGIPSELAELLHTVAVDGPAHGIHILAGTCQAERLAPDLIDLFTTRLVLQQPDAMQSIRLLGRPDAAELGGGGQLLVSVAGREPVRLRGFRVAHERLVDLVHLLDDAPGPGGSGSSGGRPSPAAETEPQGGSTISTWLPATSPSHGAPEAVASSAGRGGAGTAPDVEPVVEDDGNAVGDAGVGAGVGAGADTGVEETPVGTPGDGVEGVAATGGAVTPRGAAGAQIEVRCFGGFEVVSGDRTLSAAGQSGPRHRSWEVLAYLAAQPAEVVSTEKLLAAVWPESDQEKASSAFSAALSRLRGVLAHQVPNVAGPLVTRDRVGRTCRLEGAAMVSDVHRFVAQCREARRLPPAGAAIAYEQARALYAGDLLKDQPFRWLHERDDDGLTLPERYRETYRQITDELAGMYVRRGQPALAAPLYRELLRGESTLEDVARRLYRCYGQLADRVSLVREHHRLQQALRDAYGDPDDGGDPAMAAPEPETVAVFEAVLAQLDAQESGPQVDRGPQGGGPALREVDGRHDGPGQEDEEGCAA